MCALILSRLGIIWRYVLCYAVDAVLEAVGGTNLPLCNFFLNQVQPMTGTTARILNRPVMRIG